MSDESLRRAGFLVESEKRYSVHSLFLTIQGEGYHAGRLAVFVRFAGCSVWSGKEEDRERDSANSACARICDTEFRGIDESKGGGRYTAADLYLAASRLWPGPGLEDTPFVVFTGGEPALQVDSVLTDLFNADGWKTAIETSGTVALKAKLDWVTLSPKPPPGARDLSWTPADSCDELKVLYPLYDPLMFEGIVVKGPRWVQPVDYAVLSLGKSPHHSQLTKEARARNVLECFEFVKKHPDWRISVQGHKQLGLP